MADQNFRINCGFFDAVNSDRTYSADDMNKPYSRVVADGVFATPAGTPSTDFQVMSAGSGMQITVEKGQAIVASKWFESEAAIVIAVPTNSSLNTRIDSVILQVDKRISGRAGNVIYRTGTAAANPEPPAINQTAGVTEIRVANIEVSSSAQTIGNEAITDLRGSEDCPWVTSLIKQVDTSTLWLQYQAAYENLFDTFTAEYEQYEAEQRQAWEDFISQLTDELTVSTNVSFDTSFYTATGSVATVPINIASYDKYTDVLFVYINGLNANDSGKYTVNAAGTEITLANEINAGDTVTFICLKSIIGGDLESTISLLQRLDNKLTSFMSDTGWVELTLQNCEDARSDYKAAIRIFGNKVYIRGVIKSVPEAGTTICELPVGCAPAKNHIFTAAVYDLAGNCNGYLTIQINSSGLIKIQAVSESIAATDRVSISTAYISQTGATTALVFDYKGSVAEWADLPQNAEPGDVYMVLAADAEHYLSAGDNVLWNGAEWEILESVISSAAIDSIINDLS